MPLPRWLACDCGAQVPVTTGQGAAPCPRCGTVHRSTVDLVLPATDSLGGRFDLHARRALARKETESLTPREQASPLPAPTADAELAEGSLLAGYRLLRPLGAGGMGTVFLAHELELDRRVALKVLAPDLCRNPEYIDRFKREARAAAALNHPGITTIYAIGQHEGRHFFAMEFVEGETLADVLRRRGAVPPAQALEWARQVAEALETAQEKGFIHRDIKPSNLMLAAGGRIKVTDFGLAKPLIDSGLAQGSSPLTHPGIILGTPLYMSPEQGRGEFTDHRSDIYALGATLFHLIFGAPPFLADTPVGVIIKHCTEALPRPELPTLADAAPPAEALAAGLWPLLMRMMAKDPAQRFGRYGDLLEALAAMQAPALESASRVAPTDGAAEAQAGDVRVYVGALGPAAHPVLRLADQNLQLGRYEKAASLLHKLRADLGDVGDPTRQLATARLLEVYLRTDERASAEALARELTQGVAATGASATAPTISAWAHWCLAELCERGAIEQLGRGLAHYRAIAALPDQRLPPTLVEGRIARLNQQVDSNTRALAGTRLILQPPPTV